MPTGACDDVDTPAALLLKARMKHSLGLFAAILILCIGRVDVIGQTSDGPDHVPLDMDVLINWEDPFKITADDLGTIFKSQVESTGKKIWYDDPNEQRRAVFRNGSFDLKYTMSLFKGSIAIEALHVMVGEPRGFLMELDKDYFTKEVEQALCDKLDAALKTTHTRLINREQEPVGHNWETKTCRVFITREIDRFVSLWIVRPRGFDPSGPTEPLAANLDALLNFSSMWNTSPDAFDQLYTAKAAKKEDQKKPPQFEWMSADKSRARFSRQMFSNVETKLSMFAGSIKVEEAILEFVNGKAAKSTISFYNRGDSGDIEVKEFDRIFKTIGQNLGQVLKVSPKRQLMSTNAALPVEGWMWSSPMATALLEYNEYKVPGKVIKPEFLRLRLAAPGQTDYTMGKMVTGVQSMELVKRVTKKPDGEVYISGVPMVDQGQKGYCVAASCQRLFEYMRIPCDQHEMAQLVNVDAESGANVMVMQKSLAKIDGRFKVAFKPLVNPEQYYSGSTGKRRVSDKEFNSLVKEYVNKGVPLLWALELGRAQEEPPLPGAGQTRGGHMRMIIGYKMENNQITHILFTDSWGAGHELKRMAAYDAYDVTIGLYSMAPRGL